MQSNSSKKMESSDSTLNKNNYHINRGVEFILTGGKRKRPKSFHIVFDKILCFLNREVMIYFEFSLSVRKKKN
jgi:hypothetical protein